MMDEEERMGMKLSSPSINPTGSEDEESDSEETIDTTQKVEPETISNKVEPVKPSDP